MTSPTIELLGAITRTLWGVAVIFIGTTAMAVIVLWEVRMLGRIFGEK